MAYCSTDVQHTCHTTFFGWFICNVDQTNVQTWVSNADPNHTT